MNCARFNITTLSQANCANCKHSQSTRMKLLKFVVKFRQVSCFHVPNALSYVHLAENEYRCENKLIRKLGQQKSRQRESYISWYIQKTLSPQKKKRLSQICMFVSVSPLLSLSPFRPCRPVALSPFRPFSCLLSFVFLFAVCSSCPCLSSFIS